MVWGMSAGGLEGGREKEASRMRSALYMATMVRAIRAHGALYFEHIINISVLPLIKMQ